ncbi:glycerophosphodiester phosphodiesterase [Catenuloplanes atrovinosus]|uniref:Glycerophosphoryl diester phosphodiesterase n=1 Tax=Catenuloplanes atrovinosus TaxID=137266 RepID=A0AAE3YPH1_9ACTN|nr:glycerophosphodiester phosphodiesterase [Catenuloplanes atrovinosus]MDR7275919.1 glycerophosphoryl diester phosphodiesterase [Catenuloplanes atrovinosus]
MDHPYPYLDAPVPIAFAHRGGAADGLENTAEAFGRSVALGYRYVETDVHATADGVPVIFHDPDLRRLTGRPERVSQLSWADLASVRVSGAAAVPRLDEVLHAWPRVRFNIDVKADGGEEPTVRVIEAAGARDRVLLASFSDARLARIRALAGPRVATSMGMRAVAGLRVASLTGRRMRLPESVVAAQVPVRYGRLPVVDARLVRHAHAQGLQVHVWTIDDPAQMHALLDLGVDGIMTDRLDVLREVFRQRGLTSLDNS